MKANIKKARVINVHGQRVKLFDGDTVINAMISGKLKNIDKTSTLVAVGDFVSYSLKSDNLVSIETVNERKRCISRPAVEDNNTLQVIVSNVDKLIIITSTLNPKFSAGAVDRLLITAFREKIEPVVVLNKIDLENPSKYQNYLQAWREISCEIILTSSKTGDGIDKFKSVLVNGTSVVAGHSGVGKSSLLNMVAPILKLKTKEISDYSKKGVHTTTGVSLYQISKTGWVADTPGLKVLGLSGISKKDLHMFYPEFAKLANNCRYSDCCHVNEPGCAVKESVNLRDGRIAEFRYRGYLRIYSSL